MQDRRYVSFSIQLRLSKDQPARRRQRTNSVSQRRRRQLKLFTFYPEAKYWDFSVLEIFSSLVEKKEDGVVEKTHERERDM